MKYSLLDERDISLVHEYTFEARTEVDRNGCGASIFAYAFHFDAEKGKVGKYVQDVLWERHRGSVAPGHRVVHKNGISVDNRLENLILVPISVAQSWTLQHQLQQQRHQDREQRLRERAELGGGGSGGSRDDNAKSEVEGGPPPSTASSPSSTKHHPAGPEMSESPEQSLYWIAIQQLPQESMEEVSASRARASEYWRIYLISWSVHESPFAHFRHEDKTASRIRSLCAICNDLNGLLIQHTRRNSYHLVLFALQYAAADNSGGGHYHHRPSDNSSEAMHFYSGGNGERVDEGEHDDSFCYYECRFPPCTRIERELREFSICGRCQVNVPAFPTRSGLTSASRPSLCLV